jgi:hypothetical protein
MKIVNNTKWETRDIMKLVYRVAQDELNPGGLKNARITINYRRNGGIGGWCYYGTIQSPNVRMRLNLPRTRLDSVSLALVIAHELAHAKGVKHSEMNATRYKWGEGWRERYAYALEFPIGVRADPPKPTLDDKRQKELAKAQKMVATWTTKQKRATTTLKKWQQKAKVIERRLAASTSGASDAGCSASTASSGVGEGASPTPLTLSALVAYPS